jgi:hypothetical protein
MNFSSLRSSQHLPSPLIAFDHHFLLNALQWCVFSQEPHLQNLGDKPVAPGQEGLFLVPELALALAEVGCVEVLDFRSAN